jgi:hypothetical protein
VSPSALVGEPLLALDMICGDLGGVVKDEFLPVYALPE